MDNRISLSQLDVGYDKNKAVVKQIALEVSAGQIIAIIGANGAGKSTVLKTITRQLSKLSGQIRICEINDDSLSEEQISKCISMVMTERIHPELMTCYDMVATGRYPYTGRLGILSTRDKAAVAEALDTVGATALKDKDFMKISDGQRQRVMLARAICQDTDIMILDEPTSFLDIEFKLDILSIIRGLAKRKNKAVLMSIHELELACAMADTVVAIAENSVFKIGSPKDVITGSNLEAMYGMENGAGEILADGLWKYATALESLLCQR